MTVLHFQYRNEEDDEPVKVCQNQFQIVTSAFRHANIIIFE